MLLAPTAGTDRWYWLPALTAVPAGVLCQGSLGKREPTQQAGDCGAWRSELCRTPGRMGSTEVWVTAFCVLVYLPNTLYRFRPVSNILFLARLHHGLKKIKSKIQGPEFQQKQEAEVCLPISCFWKFEGADCVSMPIPFWN